MKVATYKNDRPRGRFPQHVSGESGWERTDKEYVAKAQELLTKFGKLMVEKGMLAP